MGVSIVLEDAGRNGMIGVPNVPSPSGGGTGTVTSVDITVPSFMAVSGNPVTTSGTLALSFSNKNANLILAGPVSGGAATPAFRGLVAADIPNLSASYDAAGAAAAALVSAEAYTDAHAGGGLTVVTKTGNYSANPGEVVLVDTTGGVIDITLPPPVLSPPSATQQEVVVKKISADVNAVTILPPSGLIDGAVSKTLGSQFASLTFVQDGTNFWII